MTCNSQINSKYFFSVFEVHFQFWRSLLAVIHYNKTAWSFLICNRNNCARDQNLLCLRTCENFLSQKGEMNRDIAELAFYIFVDIYRPREGNAFTGVCLSIGRMPSTMP